MQDYHYWLCPLYSIHVLHPVQPGACVNRISPMLCYYYSYINSSPYSICVVYLCLWYYYWNMLARSSTRLLLLRNMRIVQRSISQACNVPFTCGAWHVFSGWLNSLVLLSVFHRHGRLTPILWFWRCMLVRSSSFISLLNSSLLSRRCFTSL